MKRFLSLGLCLAMVAAASVAFAATSGTADRDINELNVAVEGPGVVLTSSSTLGSGLAPRAVCIDTFALYGGPDEPTEGKFEEANHVTPSWGGSPSNLPGGVYGGGADAWVPVDLTDQPVYWHVSQFAAENLNGHGVGNHAMWSGIEAGDPLSASWVHSPGYGNNWNDGLLYESPAVADATVGEVVGLDFFFNHDTEPGYDYLVVEYDSAGTWTEVYSRDGDNADTLGVLNPPGKRYSLEGATPIVYTGSDFGGDSNNQIRIKLSVTSDGAWSDQDGLWPTSAGAAQVDDISVSNSTETFTETFEGPAPYAFNPDKSPFAGDFAEVYPRMLDIDPCRDNLTPAIGFVDQGQVVRNGPGLSGNVSTGGETSVHVYGPGGHVINYSGGLSLGAVRLTNEIWSPEIAWAIPDAGSDAAEVAGAFIRFTVWNHLPLADGIFYLWHVRSQGSDPGDNFDDWTDRNFVYYGGFSPVWLNVQQDVSDILTAGPLNVQMALACWDYAEVFGFPGDTGTPSPVFDNAAFFKYCVGGPTFATRTIDTMQDGFPVNGSIDVSTPGSRGALDVPFDMARDVNTGDFVIDSGDSLILDIASVIPGDAVTDMRMVWALRTNPVFEDALRDGASPELGENTSTPDQGVDVGGAAVTGSAVTWTGEVVATQSTTSAGAEIADRFYFDLPDEDFMYPGDVLHYYVQATDAGGRTTTWPADISDFLVFGPSSGYNRLRTVRALPTITDRAGAQPDILVLNDFGRRGGENDFLTSLQQLGYGEGVDYDTYTTQGPSSGVSNSIGSVGAHGANADQMGGYNHILYFTGNLSTFVLSNGTNVDNNDKANDIGVLEQWHALDPGAGSRNIAYFGDYMGTALANDSAEGLAYLGATMGVQYIDQDVRDVIGGQTAPKVTPSGLFASFDDDFIAYGGCLTTNEFDQIQPLAGAAAGHYFTDAGGAPITDVSAGVASVVNATTYGLDVTFPYSMQFVYDITGRADVGTSKRTELFREVLLLFAAGGGTSGVTAAPSPVDAALSVYPNPFNPMTTVKFTAAIGAKGSVKVFNLRGELVRTLHNGEFQTQTFTWDGTDNRGASVASGVYVIKADANGQVQTAKAALVK